MGMETQGRGRQSLTSPPDPPNRRVLRRITSNGEEGWDLEPGQVASRAVPVPGPKAEQGVWAAMVDLGTQSAMVDQGTQAAMVDQGTLVGSPPPKKLLNWTVPAGTNVSWTGPAEAKVSWTGPAEAKVSWTGPAEAKVSWAGPTLGGALEALTLVGAQVALTLGGRRRSGGSDSRGCSGELDGR